MQKLEDTVSNKLNVMDVEMQHRLHVNELNMKHLIEVNELKTKINALSQGYGQHPPVQQTSNYTNAPWAPPVQQTLNYANVPPTMQNMHGYYQNLRTPGYSNILPQTLYNQIIRPPPYVQPGFIRPAAPITTHQTITPVLPQQNINRLMHEKNNEQQYAYYTRQQVQNPASLAKGNHHVNQLGHPTQIARNSTNDKVLQPYKNNQQNKSADHNRLSNEINQKVPREKANKNSKLRAPTSEVHSETRQTPSARIGNNTTQSKHVETKESPENNKSNAGNSQNNRDVTFYAYRSTGYILSKRIN